MAKVKDLGEGIFSFKCHGCNCEHVYFVNSPHWSKDSQGWNFNGDFNNPTFTPSLLNRWGKHADRNYIVNGFENESGTCHLFVTNGMIEYCGDCTHELSGQTIPLPEIN